MDSWKPEFYPFYDPYREGNMLPMIAKVGIALGFGLGYMLLQFAVMPDKSAYFQQSLWILGAIISTSIMAIYAATMAFRKVLITISAIEGDQRTCQSITRNWLSDTRLLLAGAGFATLNTLVGHLLGVPVEFHDSVLTLAMMYVGFFMSGFFAGMGLQSIIAVLVMHLRFAPNLQHGLDPENPDGSGGIGTIGDALWFFALLIGSVGALVSVYLVSVRWSYMYRDYVQLIYMFWISLPYVLAVSIVLIPGLAVRKQVSSYKDYRTQQLKQEQARLYSSYKKFSEAEDDEIITSKKELEERMENIQTQMQKLREMRTSHIDGKG